MFGRTIGIVNGSGKATMRIVGDVRVGGRPGRSTPTRHERSMSSARVRVGVTGVSISGVVIVLKGTIVGRGWTTGATRRSVHCQSPLAVRIRSGHRGGTLYAPTVDSATPGKLSRRTSFEVNSTGKEDFPFLLGKSQQHTRNESEMERQLAINQCYSLKARPASSFGIGKTAADGKC